MLLSQLTKRNDELTTLYEKIRVQTSSLHQGEVGLCPRRADFATSPLPPALLPLSIRALGVRRGEWLASADACWEHLELVSEAGGCGAAGMEIVESIDG